MTRAESTKRVEQLMAEMDAAGRDIEQRGKVAAGHLRNAAAKRAASGTAKARRMRVRVIGISADR